MLKFLDDGSKLTERKGCLFAAACYRRIWPLLTDEGMQRTVTAPGAADPEESCTGVALGRGKRSIGRWSACPEEPSHGRPATRTPRRLLRGPRPAESPGAGRLPGPGVSGQARAARPRRSAAAGARRRYGLLAGASR